MQILTFSVLKRALRLRLFAAAFLLFGTIGHSQLSFYAGTGIDWGFPFMRYSGSPAVLKTTMRSSQVQWPLFLQLRANEKFAFECGFSQNHQKWTIKDNNFSSLNKGFDAYVVNKFSYYSFYTSLYYFYNIDDVSSVYTNVGFSFNKIGQQTFSQSKLFQQGNQTINAVSDYSQKNISVPAEIGYQFRLGDDNQTLSLGIKLNLGGSSVMKGNYTLSNDTQQIVTNDYSSKGSFMGISIKYAVIIHTWDKDIVPHRRYRYKGPPLYDDTIPLVKDEPDTASVKPIAKRAIKVRTGNRLNLKGSYVTMTLWDSEVVDGDSISLMVNDKWILENFAVVKKHKTVRLYLQPGQNVIILHALNLGKVPPNTTAVTVKEKKRKYSLRNKRYHMIINSNLKSSGAIEINYTPQK